MALNIEGATIGFDANNLQSTLNHIQNNCVNNAKNALKRKSLSAFQKSEAFKRCSSYINLEQPTPL